MKQRDRSVADLEARRSVVVLALDAETNQPIAGARVTTPNTLAIKGTPWITDSEGRCVVRFDTEKSTHVRVEMQEYLSQEHSVSPMTSVEVFALVREHRIAIQVVDSEGVAVSSCSLELKWCAGVGEGSMTATKGVTDGAGRIAFVVPLGAVVWWSATPPGSRPDLGVSSGELAVREYQGSDAVLTIGRAFTLHGRVVEDGDGRPVSEALVTIGLTPWEIREYETDAAGAFVVTGLSRSHHISFPVVVTARGYQATVTMARASSASDELEVRIRPAVTGVVRVTEIGENSGVAGARVSVYEKAVILSRSVYTGNTDSSGRCSYAELSGELRRPLFILATREVPLSVGTMTTRSDEWAREGEVVVRMVACDTSATVTVMRGGRPHAGRLVRIALIEGSLDMLRPRIGGGFRYAPLSSIVPSPLVWEASTDAEGRAEFARVTRGAYAIEVVGTRSRLWDVKVGQRGASTSIEVEDGDERFVLNGVVLRQGEPVDGVFVHLLGERGIVRSVVTNRSGRFAFDAEAGEYDRLEVEVDGTRQQFGLVHGEQEIEVRLQ